MLLLARAAFLFAGRGFFSALGPLFRPVRDPWEGHPRVGLCAPPRDGLKAGDPGGLGRAIRRGGGASEILGEAPNNNGFGIPLPEFCSSCTPPRSGWAGGCHARTPLQVLKHLWLIAKPSFTVARSAVPAPPVPPYRSPPPPRRIYGYGGVQRGNPAGSRGQAGGTQIHCTASSVVRHRFAVWS